MKIARSALEAIKAHGAEGYPYEICGLLIGYPERLQVLEARPVPNLIKDRARDRYLVDGIADMRIRKQLYGTALDVVGYYHSHPDHPAKPSKFDEDNSYLGYVYVIVSVAKGKPEDANAFVAQSDGGPFRSEPLEVV